MKKKYKKPELKKIEIDKDISIMMLSVPPGGGGGGDPEWRKANPRRGVERDPGEKDDTPFKID